jgi:Fe2+ transport system protein B
VHHSIQKEIKGLENELKTDNLWVILKVLEGDQEIVEQYSKKTEFVFDEEDIDYSLEIKNNRFQFLDNHLSRCFISKRRKTSRTSSAFSSSSKRL